MHNDKLKKIKASIFIMVCLVIFAMVLGIVSMKDNFYLRQRFIELQIDYIKAEIEYAFFDLEKEDELKYEDKNFSFIEKKRAESIPILLYHGVIRNRNWQPDDVNITLDVFKKQLFTLHKAGWKTVSLEDYLSFTKGEKELPEKSFIITFDDGRSDSFYPVDPILRALDYSAVMFVITERSLDESVKQGGFHLSKTELQKMLDSGRWQMASHTKDGHGFVSINEKLEQGHFTSQKMWLASENRLETDEEYTQRIHEDLLESKEDLERELGIDVLAFAYPFGDVGNTTSNFPESHGMLLDEVRKLFPISFCQTASGDFPSNYEENSFLAKRINLNSHVSEDNLLYVMEESKDKPIAYEDLFSNNHGWLEGWGKLEFKDNAMIIRNSETEDSGLAFLSGSYLWKDYFAEAKISIANNSTFSISSRYHDGNNYVSCDYSDNKVMLTQKLNKEIISENVVMMENNLSSGRTAEIGMRTMNKTASCYLDGKIVVSEKINEDLKHGGLSFKIWNAADKNSSLTISDLKVNSMLPLKLTQSN